MGVLAALEEHARNVEIGIGVSVVSFYDPQRAQYAGAPEPVKRWRVDLPKWFPTGSWLHFQHAYASLSDAVEALVDSGALEAIDEYWKAKSDESRARNKAFSKIMSAHIRRDKSYDDLVRERQARQATS